MKKGVYIGRFQPLTVTHYAIIRFIDKQPDIGEIIIIKGSSQWSDKNPDPACLASRNPFTADECCEMLRLCLTGRLEKSWRIIKAPDTATKMIDPLWKEWVNLIVAAVGSKDFVDFTGDPREVKAFARIGCETRPYEIDTSLPYPRATQVRQKIAEGKEKEWRWMVACPEVADYLIKIKAPERIRRLLD